MTGPTDPAFWDARYQADGYLYGTRPNAFLVEHAYLLNPDMRVLMAGDGEGRNGVWLAEQGMKVVSVDFSPVALQKATKLALDRGVRLMAVCADLTDWDWPVAEYDAAALILLMADIIASLALAATPAFSGFVAKALTTSAVNAEKLSGIWLALIFASAASLAHAAIKIPYLVFFGPDKGLEVEEAPGVMLTAMAILAALSLYLGIDYGGFYALLPGEVSYAPYTPGHVIGQFQLLVGFDICFQFFSDQLIKLTGINSVVGS